MAVRGCNSSAPCHIYTSNCDDVIHHDTAGVEDPPVHDVSHLDTAGVEDSLPEDRPPHGAGPSLPLRSAL